MTDGKRDNKRVKPKSTHHWFLHQLFHIPSLISGRSATFLVNIISSTTVKPENGEDEVRNDGIQSLFKRSGISGDQLAI
jgi:hypothetical protein